MQLHGQAASILKCKQSVYFVMRECSSRNTVQFLDEIDHSHESQLRKSLGKLKKQILLMSIRPIINSTEKIHVILHMQYIFFIFSLLHGNCLNFLLWVMVFIFVAYNVYERILINFLYQRAKYRDFSKFSEISCAGMAIFAISLLLLMIFLIIWVIISESRE